MSKAHHVVWPAVLVAVLFGVWWFVSRNSPAVVSPASVVSRIQQNRTLTIIVPGTYGNDEFWPSNIPGKATFGSELQRALGPSDVVEPHLWYGGNQDSLREAAANDLAAEIDQKAASFDRICLVGHSHGGNIALLAAGKCHAKIDMVICLSTPHFYLPTKSTDGTGKSLILPIYCTWESRQNIKEIVNIFPNVDEVAGTEGWAWADTFTGVSPEAAVSLTRTWRDHVGFPRLIDDGMMTHAVGGLEILGSATLNIAEPNLMFRSFVSNDDFGRVRHSAVHSRRMGYLIGELVRDGCTPAHGDYIRRVLQPEDADHGEPIPIENQQRWLQDHDAVFHWAGWRLRKIAVQLLQSSKRIARNLDSSDPSPGLEVFTGPTAPGRLVCQTRSATNTYHASWTPDIVLLNHQTDRFVIVARHELLSSTSLGSRLISATTADEKPPESLPADAAQHIYWSADLQWEPVHY